MDVAPVSGLSQCRVRFSFALGFREMTDAQGHVGETLGGLSKMAMIFEVSDKDRVI
mgnify:FL=1